MHEARAMRDVVETVLERAREAGAIRVLRVDLALGPSGHLTEAVARRHFAVLAVGTIAAGATLVVTAMAGSYQCIGCGHRFSSLQQDAACPKCEGPALATPEQEGCYLGAIEVTSNVDDPAPDGAAAP